MTRVDPRLSSKQTVATIKQLPLNKDSGGAIWPRPARVKDSVTEFHCSSL